MEIGLYLVVLAIPFQRLEICTFGPVNASLSDLIVWPWLFAHGIRILPKGIPIGRLHFLIAFWIGAVAISGISAVDKTAFLAMFGSMLICSMTLTVSYQELSGRQDVLESVTRLYIVVASFVALFGVLQLISLIPNPMQIQFSDQVIGGGDTSRIASFLGNSNLLAGYLSVPLFLAWALYRQSSGISSLKYLAAFSLFMITLMLTFSRGAYIGFIVGAMVLVLFERGKRFVRRSLKFAIAIPIAIIIISLLSAVYSTFFKSDYVLLPNPLREDISELDSSARKRHIYWGMAVKMWKSNPIIGIGAGQFQVHFNDYLPSKYSFLKKVNAHSTYLQILAELGLVGLMAFLGLFGYVFLMVQKEKKVDYKMRRMGMAALAGLIALLVIGFVHNVLRTEIWFVAGLALAYSRKPHSGQRNSSSMSTTKKNAAHRGLT